MLNLMTYELWDTDSGNLLGAYESERAALDAVRALTRVPHLALAREDAEGRTVPIAQGAALAARAGACRPATE
jgi:hypothetical protein